MALGVYLTFRVLNFADLMVDGSFTTGAGTAAVLLVAGWNPFAATAMGFVVGFLAGTITGLLRTKGGIDGLLAARAAAEGDFVSIIGSNGAGKSTLLNMVSRRLRPDSGTVRVGNCLVMMHEGRIVYQADEAVKRELTVRDLLQEFANIKGATLSDKAFLG